jgi:hypothetical protein
MNRQLFIYLLIALPFLGYSQVGVGTNIVDPSAKFQIESNNKGFLQPRIALTSTTDITTIANPATGLMVYNTVSAGLGATAITPGVHYFDGTNWVRMDATQTNSTVGGAYSTIMSGEFLNPNTQSRPSTNISSYIKHFRTMRVAQITLPEGKWELRLSNHSLCYFSPGWSIAEGTRQAMQYWLQSDSTTDWIVSNGKYVNTNTYPTGVDNLFPGSSNLVFNNSTNTIANATHEGSFFVNNTSGASRTYFLVAADYGVNIVFGNGMPWYDLFGSSSYPYNRFYAVKIE